MSLENTFILDPVQLKRIEGVHRGFLYQHLYAAGCLFLAPTSGVTSLLVEKDEDIELLFEDHHIYIQVKTRSERLRTSDISNTLSQFSQLREAHADKQRLLSPQFWIVSNMEPGLELLKKADSSDWVKDIFLLWPGCSHDSPIAMPPAWPNLLDAIKWCTEKAQCVPFTRLSGETLVWKLAALIAFACTGSSSQMYHEFRSEDLPELFEQMVIQLQDFPKSPLPYRPQQSEPDLKSEAAVRLIIGFSGAGKTAWSSQLAMHNSDTMAYYDISDTPDQNLASSLTRELAARFLGKLKDGISTVLLPGMTGLDSLRALGKLLHMRGIQATVIIDNVHRVAPSEIRSILQAAPTLRYVLLARPWIGQQELEALLNIHAEVLRGWSTDTIAAEFAESGCVIDPAASSRILKLTGGLPLYVRNAAALTKEHYQSDARGFCDSIEAKQHVMPTAQEAVLSQIIDNITSTARDTLALLSLADVPLTVQEACSLLCSPLGISNDVAHRALRELSRIGVVQQLRDERLVIHDAFRLLASEHQTRMPEAIIRTAYLKLRNILEDSIKTKHDVSRVSLFLRLLPITGEIASLVDLASSEFFVELGFEKELRSVLEKAASAEDLSPLDRFWAMDSLAFWDLRNDNLTSVTLRLSRMEELLTAIENGKKERLNLLMKKMLLSAKQGDLKSARTAFLEACGYQDDEQSRRILRYNYAVALYHADAYRESEEEAYSLLIEYYGVLGLSPEDVFAKNPAEIMVKLTDIGEQQADLKHLADSLDLYANSRNAQNKNSGLARLHALKFYDMSNAVRSAVRVGQDVVDEQLSILHDPIAARQFMEQTLLPIIQTYKLFDYVVPVRAQYAVVLAYCGETDKANAEMRSLAPFEGALPDDRRKEIQNQKRLISKIAEGTARIGPRLHLPGQPSGVGMMTRSKRKIGRNEPCPCGSGKKYKKCCGK